jgi:hypothetical protein
MSRVAAEVTNVVVVTELDNKPAVLSALADVERDVARFFGSLSEDHFVLRAGEAWTPAEHLSHLNTAVSAVARGFGVPRWILALRFGRTRRPSRTFEEVRDVYHQRLAAGGRARGKFIPARADASSGSIAEQRAALLARWQRVNARLRSAVEGWSDRELQRTQLPHPLIGKLTAHEMLLFTIYHNQHHIAGARSRLPAQ